MNPQVIQVAPGPGLGQLEAKLSNTELKKGYRLVCGVVLNREATSRTRPHVVCAVDPLYHAGVSFCSERFVEE